MQRAALHHMKKKSPKFQLAGTDRSIQSEAMDVSVQHALQETAQLKAQAF
jgi:hypothetical protein